MLALLRSGFRCVASPHAPRSMCWVVLLSEGPCICLSAHVESSTRDRGVTRIPTSAATPTRALYSLQNSSRLCHCRQPTTWGIVACSKRQVPCLQSASSHLVLSKMLAGWRCVLACLLSCFLACLRACLFVCCCFFVCLCVCVAAPEAPTWPCHFGPP